MNLRDLWVSLVCGAVAAACGGDAPIDSTDSGQDVTVEEFTFEIGTFDRDSGTFARVDGDDVELVIGFQGLIFVDLAVVAPTEVASRLAAECRVSFVDQPDMDFSFRENRVDLEPLDAGQWGALRVPFGQDVPLLLGQRVVLDVTLAGDAWRGSGATTFTIVDEASCVEGPDGGLECD